MKERRRRKILVVIGTLAHMGGAERQAVHLMEYLTEKTECDVELLAFEDGLLIRTAVERLGVKIHAHPYYFRWPKRKRIASLARLAARIKFQVKPDAILPFVGIHSKAIAQIGRYTGAKFYWWNQQDEGRGICGTKTERRIPKTDSAMATTPSLESHRHRIDRYSASDCRQCLGKNL